MTPLQNLFSLLCVFRIVANGYATDLEEFDLKSSDTRPIETELADVAKESTEICYIVRTKRR